jgi:protein-L-isoaspartate(D-aspartate) O-methyltransferase
MREIEIMMQDINLEVELTRELIGKEALDNRVMAAMRSVPRHEFIPHALRYQAYQNGPLPIGLGQTVSQPYIVALMTDLLNPQAEDVILEIGTGSGYQTAVLSQVVKQVCSVEIIAELSQTAGERLQRLGYENVSLRSGDGYFGWPEQAPFDGIIVTAAAPHIPQPLVDQLKIGARLVIPVGREYGFQQLKVLEKTAPDSLVSHTVLGVSFVPLTGSHSTDTAYHDAFNPRV